MKHIFLILGLLVASFSLQAQTQITVSTGEYAPFTWANLNNGGFVNQVITEAFALNDIKVEFIYLPWRRAYETAKNGEYDASSFWFLNEERQKDFLMSDPVSNDPLVLVQSKKTDVINWNTIADLSGRSIGYTSGFTYPDDLIAAINKGDITGQKAPDDKGSMKKLLINRVELFVISQTTAYTLAQEITNESFDKNFMVSGKVLKDVTGHLAISRNGKNNPEELLLIFNKSIKQLRDSGRYQELLDQLKNNYY